MSIKFHKKLVKFAKSVTFGPLKKSLDPATHFLREEQNNNDIVSLYLQRSGRKVEEMAFVFYTETIPAARVGGMGWQKV